MLPRQTLLLALSSTLYLILVLPQTSAQLICDSPITSADNFQPGTPITLKYTNNLTTLGSTLLSEVSANLICSSSGESVLTLATKLESGKSSSATITLEQATSVINACPTNNFHVQYEELSLLSKRVEDCTGSFSIQSLSVKDSAQLAISLPNVPISVPLPVPEAPTATSSGSPSTASVVEPQPISTTSVPVPPTVTTTTTTAAIITKPPPPANSTPVLGTTKPTTTTKAPNNPHPTTTHPPKSGGNQNSGSDGGNSSDRPPSTTTLAVPNGDVTSSDMQQQQSTGSGPSKTTIIGVTAGVVGGVFAILAALLIWRKRSQRRADFDLFYSDTLAAASGFRRESGSGGGNVVASATATVEQPIYGRSAPEDEKYDMNGARGGLTRAPSLNIPRSHTSNHHRQQHYSNSPPIPSAAAATPLPPLMPSHPHPVASTADQDTSYHQQDTYYNPHYLQQKQDYFTSQQYQQPHPQRKPSYRLPHQHPAYDFDQGYEHPYGQH
ncbi:hypothetical protein FBU30_003268 [Linnemannia zychae]|nr:hypothetical protein FBU30_003268 [Linnemannia zychae]